MKKLLSFALTLIMSAGSLTVECGYFANAITDNSTTPELSSKETVSTRNAYAHRKLSRFDYSLNKNYEIKGKRYNIKNLPYYDYCDDFSIYYANKFSENNKKRNHAKKHIKKYNKLMHVAKDNEDWLVSRYKDGICINKYYGDEKDVVIPDELEGLPVIKIGYGYSYSDDMSKYLNTAFGQRDITSLTLPKHLKYIVEGAMDIYTCTLCIGCEYFLKEIKVHPENKYYTSIDGILYTKDEKMLLQIPANYQQPTITVKEGTKAVYSVSPYTKAHTIIIPDSVISFGERADKSEYTYQNVEGLKAYQVSENNKYYTSENGVLYDKNKTILLSYPGKKSEQSFVVPGSVKMVSNDPFNNNKLRKITIGNNVEYIGYMWKTTMGFTLLRNTSLVVKGYKNGTAHKFVKGCYKFSTSKKKLKFVPID